MQGFETARIANLLRPLGLTPGDRVAGLLDKSPEGLPLNLGCCRAGMVYLPVPVELILPEVEDVLRDAEPRLAVCRPDWAAQLRGWGGEAGGAVPAGSVGMIGLRQAFLFPGYRRAPEKTAVSFRSDGWFITGDFGRIDADGHLCVLGRGTELIITGGFNVYPKEVEAGLNALPGVQDSAAIGVPHPDFGEAVVGVVQLAPDAPPFSEEAAKARLAGELSRYKIPKRIAVVAEMPRNSLGKIRKTLLQQRFAALFAADAAERP